ncbi:MAG: hypothetical protein ACYS8Z_22175, partial [Planctomycetota bacterium]
MTIEREGEFLIHTDPEEGLYVGIESDNLAACVEEARERKAVGVFGNPYFGFKQDNLDFLADLPDLKSVCFYDIKLNNVEGVYELKQLESFSINPKRPGVDFARLPTLTELIWHYNKKDSGIETLEHLRLFHIWHCNPKSKSFDGIVVPPSVADMEINWANPKSLTGLPVMPNLKRLCIQRCRNLETLAVLPRIAPNLEHLVVDACGRVSD